MPEPTTVRMMPDTAPDGRARRRFRWWPIATLLVFALIASGAVYLLAARPTAGLVQPVGDAFTDTPAATWGPPAGLALPEARAVGPFDRAMVTDALEQAHAALLAGRAAWDGDDKAYTARFAPLDREWVGDLLTEPGRLYLVSELTTGASIRPDVRVIGDVSFSAETDENGRPSLQVRTRTVWAYAFPHAGRDRLVMVSVTVDWWFPDPADTVADGAGMWMRLSNLDVAGADCARLKLGYLAPGEPLTASGPRDASGRIDWAAFKRVEDTPQAGTDDLCFI